MYKKALKLSIQAHGPSSVNTGKIYYNMALSYEAGGDKISARQSYQKNHEIYTEIYGKDHVKTKRCEKMMAEL